MTKHDTATKMAARKFVYGLVDATHLTPLEYERVVERVLEALPPYVMCREVIAAERKRLKPAGKTAEILEQAMTKLPTSEELELIAFAAAEKDEHRPMISTADAGSDCPTFQRLAEIIAAQAEAIDALETERDLWKLTAKYAEKERTLIRDLSAKRRARHACAEMRSVEAK